MADIPADYDPNRVLEVAEAKGWIMRDESADSHGNYHVTQAGLIQLWSLIPLIERAIQVPPNP